MPGSQRSDWITAAAVTGWPARGLLARAWLVRGRTAAAGRACGTLARMTEATLASIFYAGSTLDRAADRRAAMSWPAALADHPATRLVPLWHDHCLLRDGAPLSVPGDAAAALLRELPAEPVLLGLDDGTAVFAVDLSGLPEDQAVALAGADGHADVRALVPSIGRAEAGLAAYARGLLYWHRNQQFCGTCGGATAVRQAGHLRVCQSCERLLFPRIEPAVITLVELPGRPGRCLLGRPPGAERFSTLAGFVEVGESLEDAVRREVAEETGVGVGEVVYQGSQAWPFPAGLMVGFRATALSDQIRTDGNEMAEARWFTAGELRRRAAEWPTGEPFRVDSIDKILVETWLAEQE
ncbi:MAG TPA: NAD(+) diphosphatase [Streptosporangiaceae bacterium]